MKILNFYVLVIFTILFIGCNPIPADVKDVLEKAGNNRPELEKVIYHYKKVDKDDEKLRAAYFLIENMPGKFGLYYSNNDYYTQVVKQARVFLDKDSCPDFLDKYIRKYRTEAISMLPETQLTKYYDLDIINSEFLINNIDLAFQVWRNEKWASHLDFNEFCEWILPYRVENEPIQYWRKFMIDQLLPLKDSIECLEDPKIIAHKINETIAENFIFSNELGAMPKLGGIDLWNVNAGICDHRYLLVTLAMRSMGIPVSIDFTFQYGNGPGSHSWTVLLDSDKNIKSFNGGEKEIFFYHPSICPIATSDGLPITTIFRHQFEILQEQFLEDGASKTNLDNPFIREITYQYSGLPQGDITIELRKSNISKDVYLFAFGVGVNMVAVSKSNATNGTVTFKNIGHESMYLAGYIVDGELIPDYQPFIWNEKGLKYIVPDMSQLHNIKLFRKYPIRYPMDGFAYQVIGATIEGSNDYLFNTFDTIYSISNPVKWFDIRDVQNRKSYRYYRYKSSETNPIRIAMLKFYTNNDKGIKTEIKGIPYGRVSDPGTCDDSVFKNAFDGDIRTNFNAPTGSWVAIDLGKPYKITSFGLLIRNSQNIVEPQDLYELYYFDEGWRSFGQKTAHDFYLDFESVPQDALLLLRNLTKGREERIFMYENNEQVWY